jgi:hypothetical protein
VRMQRYSRCRTLATLSCVADFMNKTLPRALVAVLCVFCATVYAQILSITRDQAAYHPERVLYPATLLSPDNFKDIESGQYVVVEGYIDYYAVTWPDADGDYHFEMQSTDKEHTHNPHSMVCAIGYLEMVK